MAFIELYDHQKEALDKLKSGAILCGDTGSGKTLTSLAWYKKEYNDRELYVITTAKKRDSNDWREEAGMLGVYINAVDSWNNIQKYVNKTNCLFIFDEQRLVGKGAWVKSFIKIAKTNDWIMLSATPGDTWLDYIPVFIANGFYKNRTQFNDMHVEFNRYVKFPQVKRYHNEGLLMKYRKMILVSMPYGKHTKKIRYDINTRYDSHIYDMTLNKRWDIFKDEPIKNASQLVQVLRKLVSGDENRQHACEELILRNERVIIFYNFDYELEILRRLCDRVEKPYSEWNGHSHDEIVEGNDWAYLVQYTAGAEGWNCTETDTVIFYSPNPSYKVVWQCEGRIDRLNTPYNNLYYYTLMSSSSIEQSMLKAYKKKVRFNQSAWVRERIPDGFRIDDTK